MSAAKANTHLHGVKRTLNFGIKYITEVLGLGIIVTYTDHILMSYASPQCLVEGTEGLNLVPLPAIEQPTIATVLIVVLLFQLNLNEECQTGHARMLCATTSTLQPTSLHLLPCSGRGVEVGGWVGWGGGGGGHANEASLHLDCYFLVAIGHTA